MAGKKAEKPSLTSEYKMAAVWWKIASEGTFLKSIVPCVNLIPVRYKTHRKFPTRKRVNPFVKLRTDLIKKLVVALVQYERVQTTYRKSLQLKKYGDLVRKNCLKYLCFLSSVSKIFNAGDIEKKVRFVAGHLRNAYMNHELRINHVLLLTFHEVNFPLQVGWDEGGGLHRMASACKSFQVHNASYYFL